MKIFLVLISLVVFAVPSVVSAYPGEMNGTVTRIVDGDTFDILAVNSTTFRVRMADINADETGEAGYAEAKAALGSMISGRTVYLDVDDLYVWDYGGAGSRIVAVVYLWHNSTHFLNVNEALFLAGHVRKTDYQNEFNPYVWLLYQPRGDVASELPSTLLLALLMVPLLAGFLFLRKRRLRIRN